MNPARCAYRPAVSEIARIKSAKTYQGNSPSCALGRASEMVTTNGLLAQYPNYWIVMLHWLGFLSAKP